MALTGDGIAKAEVTYCYEHDTARNSTGALVPVQRQLPWVFIRFADAGEPQYVAPLGAVGLTLIGSGPYLEKIEYMSRAVFAPDGQAVHVFNGGAV